MNLLVLPAEDEIPNLSKRLSWHDREGVVPSEIPPFPMYTSAERDTALLLCGWNFGPNGQNLEDYLKRWGGRREEEGGERIWNKLPANCSANLINIGAKQQKLNDLMRLLIHLSPPSREEMNEQHERAASIAVFQGQVRRGIASLKEGADVAQQQKDSNRGRHNKPPDSNGKL